MKRAFTLLELIVVVTIIAVLAAILFPAFSAAKGAAYAATSTSNLKGMYYALELYREEQDSSTGYGAYQSMGLPPSLTFKLTSRFNVYRPPLAPHPNPGSWPLQDHYWPAWLGLNGWNSYSEREEGNSAYIIDPFFNDSRVALTVPTRYTRKFLTCYLNGSVKWKFGKGEWMETPFWSQKESR